MASTIFVTETIHTQSGVNEQEARIKTNLAKIADLRAQIADLNLQNVEARGKVAKLNKHKLARDSGRVYCVECGKVQGKDF